LKKGFFLTIFALICARLAGTASSLQNLTYEIPLCSSIVIEGSPSFVLNRRDSDGFVPSVSTATYSLSCNGTNYTLQAKLSSRIPGLILEIQVQPPPNARSAGKVHLNELYQTVLSDITKTTIKQGIITYTLLQEDKRNPPKNQIGSATITFTLGL
jgi:hypothetical protein